MKTKVLSFATLCLLVVASLVNLASASEMKHVVIQVSSNDPTTQKIALNNAVNLQKLYGMDNVIVEIVAYGPGLGLMTKANENATRVESLAMQNINFSACMNTMKKVEKKTGKKPALSEGVNTTPSGIARIVELQGEGYAYIRP